MRIAATWSCLQILYCGTLSAYRNCRRLIRHRNFNHDASDVCGILSSAIERSGLDFVSVEKVPGLKSRFGTANLKYRPGDWECCSEVAKPLRKKLV